MSARFVAGRSAECRMEVYSRTGNYDILMGEANHNRFVVAHGLPSFVSLLTWDASEGSIEGEGCGWRQAASLSFEIKRLLTYNDRFTYPKQLTWDADEGTIKGEERSDGQARLRVVVSGRRLSGSAAVLHCHQHDDKSNCVYNYLYNFISSHWQPPFSHLAVKDGDLIEWSRVLLQKASASRRCASDSCYALPDQYTPDITASCTPQGILFHAYAEEGWDMSG